MSNPIDQLFLTDGGLETTLVFLDGVELPDFAAFHLLSTSEGAALVERNLRAYAEIAQAAGTGFLLETPTWRANPDWGERLGYDRAALREVNLQAVALAERIRRDYRGRMLVSGCIGPRGDGYVVGGRMTVDAAAQYHGFQVSCFAGTSVDMVCAMTMTTVEEAAGVVLAAHRCGLPAVVSFTVETDGALPDGTPLGHAIIAVDAITGDYPLYYMVNCAHPVHFKHVLDPAAPWAARLRGIRANASTRSHAELECCTELDRGDPAALALAYRALRTKMPALDILGGCCGTDPDHLQAIADQLAARVAA